MYVIMVILMLGVPSHGYQLQFSSLTQCEKAKAHIEADVKSKYKQMPVITCVEE